jgi:hypothetical protein
VRYRAGLPAIAWPAGTRTVCPSRKAEALVTVPERSATRATVSRGAMAKSSYRSSVDRSGSQARRTSSAPALSAPQRSVADSAPRHDTGVSEAPRWPARRQEYADARGSRTRCTKYGSHSTMPRTTSAYEGRLDESTTVWQPVTSAIAAYTRAITSR